MLVSARPITENLLLIDASSASKLSKFDLFQSIFRNSVEKSALPLADMSESIVESGIVLQLSSMCDARLTDSRMSEISVS